MSYFTDDFIKFLTNLNKNNNREWFHANKKDYENHVKKPWEAFVARLIEGVQEFDPDVHVTPKDAIFRIYRDVRFSKDKTPYNIHVSANISKEGKKSKSMGFYVMMKADRIAVGGGAYYLEKEQLYKIRNEILYSDKEFRSIIDGKPFHKFFSEIKGEKNKIIPKEFKEAAVNEPYLANKSFYYMQEYEDPALITSKNLDKFVLDRFKAGMPLNEFLRKAMYD